MRIIVYGVGAIGGTVAAALALSGPGGHRDRPRRAARGDPAPAACCCGRRRAPRAALPCVADPAEIDLPSGRRDPPDDEDPGHGRRPGAAARGRCHRAADLLRPERRRQRALRAPPSSRSPRRDGDDARDLLDARARSTPSRRRATACSTSAAIPPAATRHDERLAAALEAANIAAFVMPDVMQSKYGKLLLNLRNIVEAALGLDADRGRFPRRCAPRPKRALAAAGIAWRDVGAADPRRDGLMRQRPVAGSALRRLVDPEPCPRHRLDRDRLPQRRDRAARAAARRAGPGQRLFRELGARLARDGPQPRRSVTAAELEAGLKSAGVVLGP